MHKSIAMYFGQKDEGRPLRSNGDGILANTFGSAMVEKIIILALFAFVVVAGVRVFAGGTNKALVAEADCVEGVGGAGEKCGGASGGASMTPDNTPTPLAVKDPTAPTSNSSPTAPPPPGPFTPSGSPTSIPSGKAPPPPGPFPANRSPTPDPSGNTSSRGPPENFGDIPSDLPPASTAPSRKKPSLFEAWITVHNYDNGNSAYGDSKNSDLYDKTHNDTLKKSATDTGKGVWNFVVGAPSGAWNYLKGNASAGWAYATDSEYRRKEHEYYAKVGADIAKPFQDPERVIKVLAYKGRVALEKGLENKKDQIFKDYEVIKYGTPEEKAKYFGKKKAEQEIDRIKLTASIASGGVGKVVKVTKITPIKKPGKPFSSTPKVPTTVGENGVVDKFKQVEGSTVVNGHKMQRTSAGPGEVISGKVINDTKNRNIELENRRTPILPGNKSIIYGAHGVEGHGGDPHRIAAILGNKKSGYDGSQVVELNSCFGAFCTQEVADILREKYGFKKPKVIGNTGPVVGDGGKWDEWNKPTNWVESRNPGDKLSDMVLPKDEWKWSQPKGSIKPANQLPFRNSSATSTGRYGGSLPESAYHWEERFNHINTPERHSAALGKLTKVAERNNWKRTKVLEKKNGGRHIYTDGKKYYSFDTENGRFEYVSLKGKHLGEFDIDGKKKSAADSSRGHDLIVK